MQVRFYVLEQCQALTAVQAGMRECSYTVPYNTQRQALAAVIHGICDTDPVLANLAHSRHLLLICVTVMSFSLQVAEYQGSLGIIQDGNANITALFPNELVGARVLC
jgi:hypothetical protein